MIWECRDICHLHRLVRLSSVQNKSRGSTRLNKILTLYCVSPVLKFESTFERKLHKNGQILWMKTKKTLISQIFKNANNYHQRIFHTIYFWDCLFSFLFWPKSSILRISLKKFLSSKIFEDFSKFWRIFIFILRLRLRSIFNLRCNTVRTADKSERCSHVSRWASR